MKKELWPANTPQLPLDIPIRLALASQITGIPESTLREKIARGEIRARRDGMKVLVLRLRDLVDWFEGLEEATPVPPQEVTGAQRRRHVTRQTPANGPTHPHAQQTLPRPERLRLHVSDL